MFTNTTLNSDPHEAALAGLAASLPDDRSSLLDTARNALAAFHEAVMAGDTVGIEAHRLRFDAVALKLNGGTLFGSLDTGNPEAGGVLAHTHCQAAPGTVPMWGQRGAFLLEHRGMRAVVMVGEGFGLHQLAFVFHAVDVDAPFISETGFRSHFHRLALRRTVEDIAREVFSELLTKGRHPIKPDYRDGCADLLQRWPWLDLQVVQTTAPLTFEDARGQIGFAF